VTVLRAIILSFLGLVSALPGFAQGISQDRLMVALPNAAWLVEVRAPGFTVQKDEM
jgi:hypothetical protein